MNRAVQIADYALPGQRLATRVHDAHINPFGVQLRHSGFTCLSAFRQRLVRQPPFALQPARNAEPSDRLAQPVGQAFTGSVGQFPRSRRCVPLPGRRWGARQGRIEQTGLTRGLPGVVDEGALQDGGHAGG